MARDPGPDQRRRQRELRELEDEIDKQLQERRDVGLGSRRQGATTIGRTGDAETDQLLEGFHRAEPLIEQLNSLYNQFAIGVEKRPPLERRQRLDQLMLSMQGLNRPTPAYQFRYLTITARYITHREKWDKIVKDVESGKIKRVIRQKKAA